MDAALSQQLNAFVRQAVRQINHPEEMIVSINQRVGADGRVRRSIICFIPSRSMSRVCKCMRRKRVAKKSCCLRFWMDRS